MLSTRAVTSSETVPPGMGMINQTPPLALMNSGIVAVGTAVESLNPSGTRYRGCTS